jgi:hypothetical protein
MVVIASMIAVGGLGQMVLRGIGRLDMGLATVGGGIANGNCTLNSSWRGLAPNDSLASIRSAGTCLIPSMIAVGGLGQMVLRGIGRLDMGLATVGGVGIVIRQRQLHFKQQLARTGTERFARFDQVSGHLLNPKNAGAVDGGHCLDDCRRRTRPDGTARHWPSRYGTGNGTVVPVTVATAAVIAAKGLGQTVENDGEDHDADAPFRKK